MENNFTFLNHMITDPTSPRALLTENGLINDRCPAMLKSAYQGETDPNCKLGNDQEQELAVMFIDIRNFTNWMESRPAREVIHVVRRLFSAFNEIIKSFQGKTIEMAGDSLYAVFGFTNTIKEAAEQAYLSAHRLFETIDLFNKAYAVPYYGHPIEIGVGLNSGRVLVGEFGMDAHTQLSVMGLPVNVASRLQAETKEMNNNFIISEETYRLLSFINESAEQRTVQLKGLSNEQQIRLAGKPYHKTIAPASHSLDLDYLLAIAG